MSTNVYKFEERRFYFADAPTTFYGWLITTSSCDVEFRCCLFSSKEARDEFVNIVISRFPNSDESDAERYAAMLLADYSEPDSVNWIMEREPAHSLDDFDDWSEVIERLALQDS